MVNTAHALSPKTGYGTAVRISWGLVQIPVRLHLILDNDRTVPARSMFNTDTGNPVGKKNYDKITGADVADDKIVKKVEVAEGTWVELTDDEIEQTALSSFTKGVAEIVAFVPLADIAASYHVEKPGMWKPETTKVGKVKIVDPAAHKAYSLLTAAMDKRHVAALVMVPTRSGGQYVALFPDGTLGWLAYAENVRQIAPADSLPVTDSELALAEQLIDGIGVRTPVLRDEAGERVRQFLVAKAENPEAAKAQAEAAETTGEVVDLAALLAASIAQAAPLEPVKAKRTRKGAAA